MINLRVSKTRFNFVFFQARDSNAGAKEINARFGGEFKNGVGRFVHSFNCLNLSADVRFGLTSANLHRLPATHGRVRRGLSMTRRLRREGTCLPKSPCRTVVLLMILTK
jgi:hypothetical protein